jgi:lactoylglutathione lyase
MTAADEPVVNHVGQCTADLARATRFYVELLGFEVERELEIADGVAQPLLGIEPPIGLRAVYLRRGGFVLELLRFERHGNPPAAKHVINEPGLTHLSISVADVQSVVDRVPGFGGTVLASLPIATMIRDPDGQLLELLPMSYRHRVDAELAARSAGETLG